jgi:23S rRNA pseudouridine2605 synthase
MPIRKGKRSAGPGRGKTSRKISGAPDEGVDKKEFVPRHKKSLQKPGGKETKIAETLAQEGPVRLNRYIANSGVCSRREADNLISMGLITVNGKVVTELGYKVNPGDKVRYEGKLLTAEKPVYILMNKPKGYLTTTRDPKERDTVMALIGNKVRERIYPVGRLDRNTTGLLLLTNDGELAEILQRQEDL